MPPNKSDYSPPAYLKPAGFVAAAAAAALVVVGIVSRLHADREVRTWTHDQVVPTVALVAAKLDSAPQVLTLPAQLQAFENAGIHSRVPGYLKAWHVDIGERVKKGQLLAEVDTPDLDQQLAAAQADLNTARANQALSRSTAERWKNLLARDAVSQQEYDEKAGDLAAKSSVVNAAAANVGRLQATAAFKRIVAPFDGVITTRSTDIGSLISAGNAAEAPLFTVSKVDRLRVYVNVPQSFSALIHRGMTAKLTVPEHPGQTFNAVVVGDAQAIAAQTGSLLVQMEFDNKGGQLKAGGYAQATLALAGGGKAPRVPASALIIDERGVQVAVVGPDNRVSLRKVTVGRDLGASVELSSGIAPNQKVIDSPPEDLAPGEAVKIAPTAPSAAKAAANG
jgi:RND family efflux transporter MFP subunit